MKARLFTLLALLAAAAFSEAASVSDLIYAEYPTTVAITGCKSTAVGALEIPGTINGKTVTVILAEAFRNRVQLTSISVPPSVTSIGQEAFYGCSILGSITLPPGLGSLGYNAFGSCVNLTSITLPPSLVSIDSGTFSRCRSLTTITVPSGVTSIGQDAFSECTGLTTITLPPGLVSIGSGTFSRCSSLTTIAVPSSVTSIGQNAFSECTGLTAITLPPDLSTVPYELVRGCTSLAAIEIPAGVTTIGGAAFRNCTALTTVTLPAGVTMIDSLTFADCSELTSVSIPAGVTDINDQAFARCSKLATITLPASLKWVGNDAFLNCSSIPAITLAATTESIGERAFSGCTGITTVTIPASVTSIGTAAFTRCTSLGGITVAPANAHYASTNGILFSKDGTILHQCGGAALTATVPPGVTTIDDWAFTECGRLTAITLPSSVGSIGISAFASCPKLKTFLFLGNLPGFDLDVFTSSRSTTVYYLAGRWGWQYFDELPSALVGAPPIEVSLSDVVTAPGGVASLHVGVDASYPLPYQIKWRKNGIEIPGANQLMLSLPNIQPADAGVYTVVISSEAGTVSDQAALSLTAGSLYTQSQYDAGVTLGYQLGRQAGIEEIMEEPNAFDLFSSAQIQALHIGTPLLTRDAATGEFELKLGAWKSAGLGDFSPLSFAAGDLTVSPSGEILFRFSSPEGAAFFRVDAE